MPTDATPAAQEQQRQQWLHTLGLTPWVATQRLAGAALSPLLELAVVATPEPELPLPSTASSVPPRPAPAHTTPRSQPTAPATSTKSATAHTERMPRLHICQVEHTLLIVEQKDRQAPELGRDEQQLLQNLMQLFGQQSRRYPFLCPTQPEEAREALAAFAQGAVAQGCQRILMSLSATSCQQLLADQPRLRAFTLAGLPALVINSLDELLTEPLRHKRQSWQLLCEVGFVV